MKTCYKCNGKVKKTTCIKEGITLKCMKCSKCGEEYLTSSEIIKFDIKKGNRKMIRKFGVLGDSTIMRFPTSVLKNYKVKPGDYGVFEEHKEGILIKLMHAKDL